MTCRPKVLRPVLKPCHALFGYPRFENCHPERSEGSAVGFKRMSRFVLSSLARSIPFGVVVLVQSVGILFVEAQACTLAARPGYFHQVTAIRGRVVGRSLGPVQFAWLRRLFSVSKATLTLYDYSWSTARRELKKIAQVAADSKGVFDFGVVPEGHYQLGVRVQGSGSLGGWFPVEVTNKVARTKEIILDVSPIHPDCKGGQEFIETKN